MSSPYTPDAAFHHFPSPTFEHVLSRLQRLTIPSSQSPAALVSHVDTTHLQKAAFALAPDTTRNSTHVDCTLGASFSMVFPSPSKPYEQDLPTLIDTFAPKPLASDLSPTSTSSSDLDSVSSQPSNPRLSFEAFLATRSRVVRLYNLPSMAEAFLTSLFNSPMRPSGLIPVPVSMWSLRDKQDVDVSLSNGVASLVIHSKSVIATLRNGDSTSFTRRAALLTHDKTALAPPPSPLGCPF
ncbi:hypothetical protein BDN72DRAFT_897006 [Pluteus cervinus]|uniref:Uncharacterized protein n=1 Tax=Pluteus cervinus TaxID=181527 RepID=A0ACD3AY04_9AGAR|nr:hypothetical protein BDN72DRAFT_897006 [Pluteus cervinus]